MFRLRDIRKLVTLMQDGLHPFPLVLNKICFENNFLVFTTPNVSVKISVYSFLFLFEYLILSCKYRLFILLVFGNGYNTMICFLLICFWTFHSFFGRLIIRENAKFMVVHLTEFNFATTEKLQKSIPEIFVIGKQYLAVEK